MSNKLPGGNGWAAQNGWAALNRILGRRPDLIPHTINVGPIQLPATGLGGNEVQVSATAIVESDADFWCFSTMASGFITATPAQPAVIGPATSLASPDWSLAKVQVQLEQGGIRLSDKPVHLSTIFGGTLRSRQLGAAPPTSDYFSEVYEHQPHHFAVPWVLHGGSEIRSTIWWRGNDATTVYLSFHGFKRLRTSAPLPIDIFLTPQLVGLLDRYRSGGMVGRVEPFYYGFNWDETAVGDAVQEIGVNRAPIQAEQRTITVGGADFAGTMAMGALVDPAQTQLYFPETDQSAVPLTTLGSEFIPHETLSLNIDNGATRLDNRPQAFPNVAGTGRDPFFFAAPLVLPQDASLTAIMQFRDNPAGAATPLNAYYTVGGVRIFQGGHQ